MMPRPMNPIRLHVSGEDVSFAHFHVCDFRQMMRE